MSETHVTNIIFALCDLSYHDPVALCCICVVLEGNMKWIWHLTDFILQCVSLSLCLCLSLTYTPTHTI